MASVYICHVHEDRIAAEKLAAALAGQGYRLLIDGDLDDVQRADLAANLKQCHAVVVLLSTAIAASQFIHTIVGEANRLGLLVLVRVSGLSAKKLATEYGIGHSIDENDFDGICRAITFVSLKASGSSARRSVAGPAVEPGSPSPRPSYAPPREGIGAAAESARFPLSPSSDRYSATRTEGVGAAAGAIARPAAVAAPQQEALAAEAGRLVHKIPEKMWVGEQETVEVRLGRAAAEGLTQGLVGRGALSSQDIPILETMSVSIYTKGGAFDIERQSETTQLVSGEHLKGTAFEQADYGRWVWQVTPRKTGAHQLFVRVSASLKDSRGLPTSTSLPDREFPVSVSVHTGKTAVRIVRRGLLAAGGAVGAGLLGAITQELWWPKLKTLLQSLGWLG